METLIKGFVASNIRWDTDGEKVDLPNEVYVPIEDILDEEEVGSGIPLEELWDRVTDHLSDDYDFCIFGYNAKVIWKEDA